MRLWPIAVAAATAVGCAGSEPIAVADAGLAVQGPRVQVGTGTDEFEALEADQVMPLVRGPQGGGRSGGYHIWSSLQTHGLEPDSLEIHLTIRRADDDVVLSSKQRKLRLRPSNGATDAYSAYGLAMILDDCCPASDAPLLMRVEVTDVAGLTASDEARVRGELGCLDINGIDLCSL